MPTTVYAKTTLGEHVLAERSRELLPRQRQVLIMVDGKRTAAELSRFFADAQAVLEQLSAGGFIAAVATGQPAQASAAPPVAPEAQPQVAAPELNPPKLTGQALPDAKRRAVRALTDAMGPNADGACMRIESAKTVEDFELAVTRGAALLRGIRGADAAQEFLAAFTNPV